MEITKNAILEMLYESIDELNEQRSSDKQLARSPQTLLGDGPGLDSLAFVNLVALIEERCQERFGKGLVLSDALVEAGMRDPFETVGSLAEFIELSLTDRLAYWR